MPRGGGGHAMLHGINYLLRLLPQQIPVTDGQSKGHPKLLDAAIRQVF